MKITIVRHGKPDFVWERMVKGSEVKELQETYNASGIVDQPPQLLKGLAEEHNFVVTSDLPRSVQSARAIGASIIHLSASDFRELSIPSFDRVAIRLPIRLWVVILRVLWLFGFSKNAESIADAKSRAKAASDKLIEFARAHDSVLFVGHGTLNHFVARQLLRNNWVGPLSPGRKHWQYATYRYEQK